MMNIPDPMPLAEYIAQADKTQRQVVAQVETALELLQPPGGNDLSALWRLARAAGYLSRGLDSEDYQTLVIDSLAEGKRGEVL